MKTTRRPRVAVLGPEGTNTHKAAEEIWGSRKFEYVSDISNIFGMVSKKQATYGLVPVEDSVQGDVPFTLDCLMRNDLYVIREIQFPVTHCLLSKGYEKTIKVIASHPQALAHCRRYLDANFPGLERRPTSSTAQAARLASSDSTIGALASEWVADTYGLKVQRREIHDRGSNTTRFFVLARKPVRPRGRAKTSIIVDLPEDQPGALHRILVEFARRKINLTRIVSRPARGKLGEYVFYIDLDGNQEDKEVKDAFEAIKKMATIRSLGSYSVKYVPKKNAVKETGYKVPIDNLRLMASSLQFWNSEEDRIYDHVKI